MNFMGPPPPAKSPAAGRRRDLPPHQLVQRYPVEVRQADQGGQLRLPLAAFIILVSAERNTDFICDCCLGQMPVFSKLYKAVRKVGQNKIPP